MGPPATASRHVAWALAAMLVAFPIAPLPARAQSGNGLYEPFPEAAVKERARRYVERLGDRTPTPGKRYSDSDLAAGVFVQGGHPLNVSPGPASMRAGGGGDDVATPLQIVLVALLLAGVTAALLAWRRREHAT